MIGHGFAPSRDRSLKIWRGGRSADLRPEPTWPPAFALRGPRFDFRRQPALRHGRFTQADRMLGSFAGTVGTPLSSTARSDPVHPPPILSLRRAKGYQTPRTSGFPPEQIPLDRSPSPLQAWYQEAPPPRWEHLRHTMARDQGGKVAPAPRQKRSCCREMTDVDAERLRGFVRRAHRKRTLRTSLEGGKATFASCGVRILLCRRRQPVSPTESRESCQSSRMTM